MKLYICWGTFKAPRPGHGEVSSGSDKIVNWARDNPASGADRA